MSYRDPYDPPVPKPAPLLYPGAFLSEVLEAIHAEKVVQVLRPDPAAILRMRWSTIDPADLDFELSGICALPRTVSDPLRPQDFEERSVDDVKIRIVRVPWSPCEVNLHPGKASDPIAAALRLDHSDGEKERIVPIVGVGRNSYADPNFCLIALATEISPQHGRWVRIYNMPREYPPGAGG